MWYLFQVKGYEKILGCEKVKKRFWLGDLFIFIYIYSVFSAIIKRACKVLT